MEVIVDDWLRFIIIFSSMCKRINSKVHLLSRNPYLFSMDFRSTLFKIFFQSSFDYCSSLFIYLDNQMYKNRLESVFNRSIRKLLNINLHKKPPNFQFALLHNFDILPLNFIFFQDFILILNLTFPLHLLFLFSNSIIETILIKILLILRKNTRFH